MDWILRNVAVGSWEDASPANQNLLESEKVGAILNVRSDENDVSKREANEREEKYCSSHNIGYCPIPVEDFTKATIDQLVAGVAFIAREVESGRKVLVHCGAGWGRSPSFVAAYLLFSKECNDTMSAVELIQQKRPRCFEDGDNIHIARIREFEKMSRQGLTKKPRSPKKSDLGSGEELMRVRGFLRESMRGLPGEKKCPHCGATLTEEEYDCSKVLCASELTGKEEFTSFDDVSVLNTFTLPLNRERQFMKGQAKLWSCEQHNFLEFPDGMWYEMDPEEVEWKECSGFPLENRVLNRSQKTLGKWIRKKKEKKQSRGSKAGKQKFNKGEST